MDGLRRGMVGSCTESCLSGEEFGKGERVVEREEGMITCWINRGIG